MTFYLYVQQNQWIVITVLASIALTLLFCLTYQAMWHPRGVEGKTEKIQVKDLRSFLAWLTSFMPWVIVLLILMSLSFTVATVIWKSIVPPNW